MRHFRHARSTVRIAHFERYEDRLVFSTVPWIEPWAAPQPDWVSTLPGSSESTSADVASSTLAAGQDALSYVPHHVWPLGRRADGSHH